MYSVGDTVVYPHHGAGKIMKIEQKDVLGQQRDYLTIQILHDHMTVMVPVENADRAGLRRVVGADTTGRSTDIDCCADASLSRVGRRKVARGATTPAQAASVRASAGVVQS